MATTYPLVITQMDCLPLVMDNSYSVVETDLLANWVAQLLLGNSLHIARVIEGLDSQAISMKNKTIDGVIKKLEEADVYKRDGWLFQMISWIALKMTLQAQYGNKGVFMNAPHTAAAQQGMDGFALVVDDKNMIKYIVLCEDKCSEHARSIITSQVYPEFIEFEDGYHDNRVVTEISSIIRGEDGDIFDDRVEFMNPGAFPPGTEPKDFLKRPHSEPVNEKTAMALFKGGVMEGWGRGIPDIYDLCKAAGMPEPVFDFVPNFVCLTIRFKTPLRPYTSGGGEINGVSCAEKS